MLWMSPEYAKDVELNSDGMDYPQLSKSPPKFNGLFTSTFPRVEKSRPPDCDREVLFGVQRVPRGVFRCRLLLFFDGRLQISYTIFTETLSDPQSLRTL
ncbi:hypothetical protein PAPYR_4936 [Paratrimastix pyriformis]|uniref:Uncharacterized protein n=1 Tax=Paratrimastix pyriformis TaxID=342808 RepID=A0ABQ8UMB8_9EUKA|nr:hypothetical protein PAPYR_4936 [Paratrimastix pyriformis]